MVLMLRCAGHAVSRVLTRANSCHGSSAGCYANGIQGWGLKSYTAEMAQAIHVLQGFVDEHMLNRIAPDEWGSWYEDAR